NPHALLWFDEIECRILDAERLPRQLDLAGHVFDIPAGVAGPGAVKLITRAMKKLRHVERERIIAALEEVFPVKPGACNRYRLFNRDEMRQVAVSGFEIGGHTMSHAILRHENLDARRNAIASNFEAIREITGVAPVTFAYPDGRAE